MRRAVLLLVLVCGMPFQAAALSEYNSTSIDWHLWDSRIADRPFVLAQIPTPAPAPAPAVAPATTQNTITTTAPVSSETTISVGTIAGNVLQWLAAAFSVPIGGLLTGWLYRLFKLAGVQVADGLRAKLQEIVINGLNIGAKATQDSMLGRGKIEIKNAVVQNAIAYTQLHGAETIKALGLDPKSGAAVEAIKARIETAINDPITPTPAVLDPAIPAKA